MQAGAHTAAVAMCGRAMEGICRHFGTKNQFGFETAPGANDWANDVGSGQSVLSGGGVLKLTAPEGTHYFENPRVADTNPPTYYYTYGGDGGYSYFGNGRTPTVYSGDYYMAVDIFAIIPEPASLSLLAFGGLVLLRRRRG